MFPLRIEPKPSGPRTTEPSTYIIAVLQRAHHAGVHVVVVQGHEERVHHDAERDEQVHKRVEHDKREKLGQPGLTQLAQWHHQKVRID